MYKIIVTILFFSVSLTVFGQRKTDLINEIAFLQKQLDSVKNVAIEAQRVEKASVTETESYKKQVVELQEANTTLMKNLNTFATVSNKNTEIVNTAMTTLEAKEKQLKLITNTLSSNDSTAVIVLTNAKQTLGENAKVGVANGKIIVSESLGNLFTEETSAVVKEEAFSFIEKISQIVTSNNSIVVTIEGLSMTGNLDLPLQQASAIAQTLITKHKIDGTRIIVNAKDGNLKEGINIKFHPNYGAFYDMVKAEMKN